MRALLFDRRVFVTNGGGGTKVEGAVAYFYLVAKDVGLLEQELHEFQAGKTELYRHAIHTDKVAFAVIDLSSDQLKRNLASGFGPTLYSNIVNAAPCIVKTSTRLIDVVSMDNVTISKLANPDQDFQWAVVEMSRLTLGDRTSLLNILKFVQKNFKIEPGLFGLKWHGNAALQRWIESLEKAGFQSSN